MISNDNRQCLTVEIYNAGNSRLGKQIVRLGERWDSSFSELKNEIQAVKGIVLASGAKGQDMTNTYVAQAINEVVVKTLKL